MSFVITWDNYPEAVAVCKNIMWMYHDMITSYGGFGHNVDFEGIDYTRYFFGASEPDTTLTDLATLLRQGACTALCCEAVNLLDEAQRSSRYQATVEKLLGAPEIADMPFEAEVLRGILAAFADHPDEGWEAQENGAKLHALLRQVANNYVFGYYRRSLGDTD